MTHTRQTAKVSDYTDTDLINDFLATFRAVEIDKECSFNDIMRLEEEEVELQDRGYRIIKSVEVVDGRL